MSDTINELVFPQDIACEKVVTADGDTLYLQGSLFGRDEFPVGQTFSYELIKLYEDNTYQREIGCAIKELDENGLYKLNRFSPYAFDDVIGSRKWIAGTKRPTNMTGAGAKQLYVQTYLSMVRYKSGWLLDWELGRQESIEGYPSQYTSNHFYVDTDKTNALTIFTTGRTVFNFPVGLPYAKAFYETNIKQKQLAKAGDVVSNGSSFQAWTGSSWRTI